MNEIFCHYVGKTNSLHIRYEIMDNYCGFYYLSFKILFYFCSWENCVNIRSSVDTFFRIKIKNIF